MKKSVRTVGGLLLGLLCIGLWWTVASDYGESVAVGRYRFGRNGETSTLVLNPDHTFDQERDRAGLNEHARGTWRRVGEGGISFSREFLVVSGEEPEPDGTTFSDLHKSLGLFVSLRLRQYHVLWYGRTSSVQDNSVEGTYAGDEEGAPAVLYVRADHSFDQAVTTNGIAKHASGTWSQSPDRSIRLSSAFLKTSGEPLHADESATAMDPRGNPNLQIEVAVSGETPQPNFEKSLASW
jgi:hypothetical protein